MLDSTACKGEVITFGYVTSLSTLLQFVRHIPLGHAVLPGPGVIPLVQLAGCWTVCLW